MSGHLMNPPTRGKKKRKVGRVLYRHGLTNDELAHFIEEVGVDRIELALDAVVYRTLPLRQFELFSAA
jgi:hypothetical protein